MTHPTGTTRRRVVGGMLAVSLIARGSTAQSGDGLFDTIADPKTAAWLWP